MEWIILASGSSGNASLLRWRRQGLLIDGGLSPSKLRGLLGTLGVDPAEIQGLVLTHIHGDHCHPGLVKELVGAGLPVFAHESHFRPLAARAGLSGPQIRRLQPLDPGQSTPIFSGWVARTLPIPHGDMVNQAVILELDPGLFEPGLRLGHLTDLGDWNDDLARFASNCDLLGLEFNHDESLQRASGRPAFLIQRNLGGDGHLSNEQAGRLLERIHQLSLERPLKGLVQLHLSRSCNAPGLAREAATQWGSPNPGQKRKPRLWTCVPGGNPLRIQWSPRSGLARQGRQGNTAPAVRRQAVKCPVAPGPTFFELLGRTD